MQGHGGVQPCSWSELGPPRSSSEPLSLPPHPPSLLQTQRPKAGELVWGSSKEKGVLGQGLKGFGRFLSQAEQGQALGILDSEVKGGS